MMFLLFHLGEHRYVIEARRVVEVLPLVELNPLPFPARGVAGLFNYHGQPVPAVDLAVLALGRPARECLSTRIILVQHPDDRGTSRLVGLVAERATEILRRDRNEFSEPGLRIPGAPYLGPVLMDQQGPIHWVEEQRLLPDSMRELLFKSGAEVSA